MSYLPYFEFVGTAGAVGAKACVRAEGQTGDSLGKREAGKRGEGERTKEEHREGDDAASLAGKISSGCMSKAETVMFS